MIDLIVSGLLYLAWAAAILAGLIIVVMVVLAAMCCIPQAKVCQGCRSAVRWYHWKSKTETVFHLKCYSAWETGYDQGVNFGIKSQSYYEKAKNAQTAKTESMTGVWVSLDGPPIHWNASLPTHEDHARWNVKETEWERFCRRIEMPEVE